MVPMPLLAVMRSVPPGVDAHADIAGGGLRLPDPDTLTLFYQPIKSTTGGFECVEALARFRDDTGALAGPASFAPALDTDAHARLLGARVMEAAFAQAEAWHLGGLDIRVCMNVSPRYLNDDSFIADLDAALGRHPDILPGRIEFEITETAPIPSLERAEERLQECIIRGIRVAIDDFGAGSASLSYLQRLSTHTVKIDQKFVARMIDFPKDMAIVAGIITAGRMLGIDIVAEGVETTDQESLLSTMGVSHLQGFLYAKPMPSIEVEKRIRDCQRTESRPMKPASINLVDTIVAGHVHRTNLFIKTFNDRGFLPDHLLDVTEVDNCHLGRWLKSDGARHFSCQPVFDDIQVLHEALHRLAREAKLCMVGGRTGKARALIRVFEETNVALVSRIESLPAGTRQ